MIVSAERQHLVVLGKRVHGAHSLVAPTLAVPRQAVQSGLPSLRSMEEGTWGGW